MNQRITTIAFGICFAIALYAASYAQIGPPPGGGGGGGTPGGSTTQVQYNNAGAFGGMAGTVWDDTNRSLAISGATVTTNKPLLDLAQTWNAGAVNFVGLNLAMTNTASSGRSSALTASFGGTVGFQINRCNTTSFGTCASGNSVLTLSSAAGAATMTENSGNFIFGRADVNAVCCVAAGYISGSYPGLSVPNNGRIGFSPSTQVDGGNSAQDTSIYRNAAGVVEVNNGTPGAYRDAKLRSVISGGTVPGISGCSAGTQTGGATAGTYASGTTGVCSVTLTFAFTAPAGWNCSANNQTTANLIRQTGGSTTTAVISGTTVSGDVVSFGCMAF